MLRRIRSSRGQTLIEFALVAPLIFVFLFTIVDFGIAIDRRITLQHAVREGARFAAVHTNTSDIQQQTVDQAQDLIGAGDVSVCYVDNDSNGNPGNAGDGVRVTGTFTYDFAILGDIFGGFGLGGLSIDMTPSGTARLEQTVNGAVPCA